MKKEELYTRPTKPAGENGQINVTTLVVRVGTGKDHTPV